MAQTRIRAAFIRGGTSKGVFFHRKDLPDGQAERDKVLLAVLGSPDPYERQLDGLGGGISSLSKAVMISPSARDDADIDFTFAQVSVDEALVDYGGTCGNLSSAVGPFAVDEGLIEVPNGETVVRIHNTNTSKVFHARFAVADGTAAISGDQRIPGVSTTGAPVALEFLDPGGSMSSSLLPTGNPIDEIATDAGEHFRVSMVDATNPIVFVSAADLKATATEQPTELEARSELTERLEAIRRAAGVAMGLATSQEAVARAVPKVAMVAPPSAAIDLRGRAIPANGMDILARAVSMGRIHRALPLTLSMCLGTACRIPGTVAHQCARPNDAAASVRIANPSGIMTVSGDVYRGDDGQWKVSVCRVVRTQRRLMDGHVFVPTDTAVR